MVDSRENKKVLQPSSGQTHRRGSGQAWWQPALVIGSQVTGWILGPLLIALFLGRWLDQKYSSQPKFLLISVGIAFIISNVGIILNTLKAAKDLEKITPKENLSKSKKQKDAVKSKSNN